MTESRGLKNAAFGVLSELLTSAVGVILPRLVLVSLGSESNGLLNSVTSVLSYMSLLEAGVGGATLQALYKPCAERDRDSVNSIMAATDQFYRRTGKAYLIIVVAISIGYALAVRTELSRLDVFAVVLLSGPSGSGKTTLLNCVSTIDKATSGHILVDGRDVIGLNR